MRPIILALLMLLAATATPVSAGWEPLSDDELDEISAGGVDLSLQVNPEDQLVDFTFSTGGTTGNGSAAVSPVQSPTSLPPTFVFNGATNLANATLFVENWVFNLNICVMCKADSIIQQGIGIPITIKTGQ